MSAQWHTVNRGLILEEDVLQTDGVAMMSKVKVELVRSVMLTDRQID